MRLIAMVVAGAVLGAVPSLAQQPAPAAGRYQIAPDENGFVRLDTETGAMSHCVKREGAWHCDVLAEDRSATDARIEGLMRQVEALTRKVEELAGRLTTLEAARNGEDATAKAPTFDDAVSFAERLMQRFFDMVRQLKTEEEPSRRI